MIRCDGQVTLPYCCCMHSHTCTFFTLAQRFTLITLFTLVTLVTLFTPFTLFTLITLFTLSDFFLSTNASFIISQVIQLSVTARCDGKM